MTEAVEPQSEGVPDYAPVEATEAEHHTAYYNDPVSGNARSTIAVGDLTMMGIADGYFVLPPDMIGTSDNPTVVYDHLQVDDQPVRLPVGAFLIPGDKNILLDTGYGPVEYEEGRRIYGGRLLPRLAELGLTPADIDIIGMSHLHFDHSGNIGGRQSGEPVFPNAKIYIGAADWKYFVEERGPVVALEEYIRLALLEMDRRGQVELMDSDTDITPNLRAVQAPGHTPGHFIYSVHDNSDRVFVLGDSFVCPEHLTEVDWTIVFDNDIPMARKTRERLARELERHGGGAVAPHFPELAVLDRVVKQA